MPDWMPSWGTTALISIASSLLTLIVAGRYVSPLLEVDDPEGGLLVSVFEDLDHVHVSWGMHDRLHEAATDMQDAGRQSEDVVVRYETTRATMHLALGSILNAFGYSARPHALGFGHIIRRSTQ
jgi:hypothetical protein